MRAGTGGRNGAIGKHSRARRDVDVVDALLGGLLGIRPKNGRIAVSPRVPDAWEYFAVESLWIGDRRYRVVFDKSGEKYGYGKGLHIFEIRDEKENKLA